MLTLVPSNIASASEMREAQDAIVVDGNMFILDEHAAEVMRSVLEALQRGASVEISEAVEYITTQEAADMVGVSRPSLVKMLDEGVLPSHRPGIHRRVRRADVEAFLQARTTRRRGAMDALHDSRSSLDDALEGFVNTR